MCNTLRILVIFLECIEKVEIIQKELVAVGYGGTTRINGSIISSLTRPVKVNWQKKQNNYWANLVINCPKYSGSSCHVNNPHLVINNIDKEDAGIYKLEVSSPIEARSSPGILLELYGGKHIVFLFCSVAAFPFSQLQ